jgi:DNA invertase Pin-like site-specific DNA recombinase
MMQQDLVSLLQKTKRFQRKKETKLDPLKLTQLPHEKLAVVYQRLSRQEQVENSIWSLKAQDALYDLAKEHGYPDELIHMEKRDLGVSGTLNQDQREGLAYLMSLVAQDKVESVYIVESSRLYRDQTLINAYTLAELLKKHNVIIITSRMRLNLNDKMHMRMFRIEMERSADELDMMRERLGGALQRKAKAGFYTGGQIPLGYILDTEKYLSNRKTNPNYNKIKPYPPHAEIIKEIFHRLYHDGLSPHSLALAFYLEGKIIPEFDPSAQEIAKGRTGLSRTKKVPGGYAILPSLIRGIITNPVYIGWWVRGGEVISTDNHEPLIDEDVFWAVFERFQGDNNHARRGKAAYTEPLPLSWLLYCVDHGGEQHVDACTARKSYQCDGLYNIGVEGGKHFYVPAYVLDDPVREFVVSQCSYSEYADGVLKRLEDEREQQAMRADRLRKQRSKLEEEIETLQGNLAYTKSQEQVQLIFEEIDKRKRELKLLSQQEGSSPPKTLSSKEIGLVRDFLTNISQYWDRMPDELKNRFLRLVLDRILISYEEQSHSFKTTICWRTGLKQEIKIYHPSWRKEGDWTEPEILLLKKLWAYEPRETILKALPDHTWTAIRTKAKRLGLRREMKTRIGEKRRTWKPEEDEVVRKYYAGKLSLAEAIANIERAPDAIWSRARSLGLRGTRKEAKARYDIDHSIHLSEPHWRPKPGEQSIKPDGN